MTKIIFAYYLVNQVMCHKNNKLIQNKKILINFF